jgi:arylsulfatase A-like enzyme
MLVGRAISRPGALSLLLLGLVLFKLPSAAASKPNIILVTLDSARADRMGFLGAKTGTPSLDALSKQSVIFERAYAQAPLTVVSHATILSGTYPQVHHASELGSSLSPGVPYVPELLHNHGYRSGAFVGSLLLDPRNGFASGFDRGFDAYDAGFHPIQPGESGAPLIRRSGAQVVARAITWLNRKPQGPFFLWVHLNDAHAPYGSYDRGTAAADAAVGKFMAALRSHKLYDDSIIVVTSDHGEGLGAHGEDTHGIFLYDETIRVPLLVKLPQQQMAAKRVKGRVRLLDIAPTILETAGVPIPSQMQGQSLLRIAKGKPEVDQPGYSRSDFSQQAFGWSVLESWRAGKYLYIRVPRPELYDLSTDPNATRDLSLSSKAILETLAAQLNSFDSRLQNAGKPGDTGLTSSEMQKLASLGYAGLQKANAGAATAAVGTDPKDTISIANKVLSAWVALEAGQAEQATAMFRHALAGQANSYLAQYGLGVALAQQQQLAEATEHLHKAIELRPESGWAQYQMGVTLMKTGNYKTAAVHLEIASSRLPGWTAAHSALAQVYEKLGRKEDANRERAKAARIGGKA